MCSVSQKCIPNQWVCDYQRDCPDGEDEKQNCREYKHLPISPIIPFSFGGYSVDAILTHAIKAWSLPV